MFNQFLAVSFNAQKLAHCDWSKKQKRIKIIKF